MLCHLDVHLDAHLDAPPPRPSDTSSPGHIIPPPSRHPPRRSATSALRHPDAHLKAPPPRRPPRLGALGLAFRLGLLGSALLARSPSARYPRIGHLGPVTSDRHPRIDPARFGPLGMTPTKWSQAQLPQRVSPSVSSTIGTEPQRCTAQPTLCLIGTAPSARCPIGKQSDRRVAPSAHCPMRPIGAEPIDAESHRRVSPKTLTPRRRSANYPLSSLLSPLSPLPSPLFPLPASHSPFYLPFPSVAQ